MMHCLRVKARNMNCWLSKLASTFVLALVEEKVTPFNSLYFSIQISLKILTKQSKTKLPKHACISMLNNVCLAGSGIKSAPFKAFYHLCPCSCRRDFKAILSLVILYTVIHEDFSESILNNWRHCLC